MGLADSIGSLPPGMTNKITRRLIACITGSAPTMLSDEYWVFFRDFLQ